MAIVTAIDADTSSIVEVKSRNDGTDDRLLVSNNVDGRTSKIEYQAVSGVAGNTITNVFSFTNTTGGDIFVNGIGGTGSARAEWQILVDAAIVARRRTSVATPSIEVPFHGLVISNTSVVVIKVTHFESGTQDFQADMRYSQ